MSIVGTALETLITSVAQTCTRSVSLYVSLVKYRMNGQTSPLQVLAMVLRLAR